MALKIVRGMFILSCMIMGVIWANHIMGLNADPTSQEPGSTSFPIQLLGGALGAAIAITVLLGLHFVTQELFERLFPAFIAVTLSMSLGYFFARYIMLIWPPEEDELNTHIYLTTTFVLVFGTAGILLGLTRASSFQELVTAVKERKIHSGNPKIVDTSVIIDGRIVDILKTGFLEGTLIVPRFVLNELQHIADSADDLRRNKGRRGLDILKSMQDNSGNVHVEVVDDDPKEATEVDAKILVLAKLYGAKVITNDFNLNKVAQIEGIEVLNINDLSNALKPSMLPDERLEVKIVKEGKEQDQGVGYLDDGTMIVVDGGRSHVGKVVSVQVTSVLQTAAGRMIFTKMNSSRPDSAARLSNE